MKKWSLYIFKISSKNVFLHQNYLGIFNLSKQQILKIFIFFFTVYRVRSAVIGRNCIPIGEYSLWKIYKNERRFFVASARNGSYLMRLSLLEHIFACKLSEYYMEKSYWQTLLQYKCGKFKFLWFFLYKNSIGIANGDTMTKNNNQSLKIKDGHEVPKKGEY